ncbi:MAG: hypothetical protein Kow0042_04750 [Calditrichia bacterium]
MKTKNTIILFLILILLSAYVYIFEIKKHEEVQKLRKESKKVTALARDSIEVIRIHNKHGDFVIKKIQGEWRLTEPIYTGADESAVNSMLSILEDSQKDTAYTVQPGELKDFGLGERALRVRLETSAGKTDSIRFGDKTPVGANIFCNKSDSVIFTLNQSVKNTFDKKLYDLRDKKLLHFQRDDVQKITLRNRYGTFEFEKVGKDEWMIPRIDRPADYSKLSSILSKLQYNNAKTFVDEEGTKLSKYGLLKPAYEVQLFLGLEKGQRKLKISKKLDGKYYAQDESRKPIFEIDSTLVKDVDKKLTEFRSKDLARFDRNAVDRIIIQYNDTLITCLKDSTNNWVLDDAGGQKLKTNKINSFFSDLDYTTISEFVRDGKYNPSAYGLDKPAVQVALYKGEDLIIEVKLGKKKDDQIYAVTNQYESVYLIPASKLKNFKLKLDDIREPVEEKTETIS